MAARRGVLRQRRTGHTDSGEIVIYFERDPLLVHQPSLQQTPISTLPKLSPAIGELVPASHVTECCEALAEAERAGKAFIAFKWFRDEALPQKSYLWASNPEERQRVLAQAIATGAVSTSRIPNPRAPQHPTTTVSLNRTVPLSSSATRFRPVPVQGEPVSHTILRDRGSL